MNGSLRLVLLLFGAVVLGYIAVKVVLSLALSLIGLLLPVAVVAALGYGLYNIASGRPVLGGRRRILP